MAEVEVDTETGMIEVVRLVVVHDAGTVMFPAGAEAQQIGAQVQSIGELSYEEVVYDRDSGLPLSFDWIDYTMPTMLDMPVVELGLLEVWRGAGEYGACGIGESAITCTPRAILNAVYNATGVRINEVPAKPEKVLDALARKSRGGPEVDEDLAVSIRNRLDAADALAAAEDAPQAGTSGSRVPADHATRRAAEGVARSSASSVAPAHHSAKSLEEAAAGWKLPAAPARSPAAPISSAS